MSFRFVNLAGVARRVAFAGLTRPGAQVAGARVRRAAAGGMVVGRGLASAPAATKGVGEEDDGKLPLEGIRVLDMTRVLAGVCRVPRHPSLDVWLQGREGVSNGMDGC
jgi:hypothetical protein